MEHKFLNKTKKLSLSQINFKEYFEFYRDFICPYIYSYTLEDDTEIEIRFHEEHFSHLLGLHKFQTLKSYKKTNKLINDILSEKINFKNVYSAEKDFIEKNIELRDRVSYFPTLKTLLENTEIVLQYNLNIIWNSKIKFSFLLKTDKISILVYLAVKKINENKKICVPVSFLVDRSNRFSKTPLKKIKVKSIGIIKKQYNS